MMSKLSVYTIAGIWAIALIVTSIILKGTPQSNLVIEILSSCALISSLVLIFSCRTPKEKVKLGGSSV
jgi:hypothetical protein